MRVERDERCREASVGRGRERQFERDGDPIVLEAYAGTRGEAGTAPRVGHGAGASPRTHVSSWTWTVVAPAARDVGPTVSRLLERRGVIFLPSYTYIYMSSRLGRRAAQEASLPAKAGSSLAKRAAPSASFEASDPVSPILRWDRIQALHAAAIHTNLALNRTALLAGMEPSFVASLREAPTPAGQLLVDLHELNRAGTLIDGSVPLALWLSNAMTLAGGRKGAKLFQSTSQEIAATLAAPATHSGGA